MTEHLKKTRWKLWLLGILKIPQIAWVGPKLRFIDDQKCELLIPLGFRTKNHLGSMYFGSLCVGADLVGGLLALHHMEKTKRKIELVFTEFQASFLKKPRTDVLFRCAVGDQVHKLVQQVIEKKERLSLVLPIEAYLVNEPSEMVAKFSLTLSLKDKTHQDKQHSV